MAKNINMDENVVNAAVEAAIPEAVDMAIPMTAGTAKRKVGIVAGTAIIVTGAIFGIVKLCQYVGEKKSEKTQDASKTEIDNVKVAERDFCDVDAEAEEE